ncbi:hypothetical protein RF11_02732 [Thelohanellus kitauei]|uniref:Uncharacterized protein n=1 Tax=Thelohanellus kitauei TaxID=669202 RepID=A0A0C2MUF5_THEKT|nr:hypothetical protein RF11_02732 [Thelohanellus kitauei]
MSYTCVTLETELNPKEDIVQQIEDLEDRKESRLRVAIPKDLKQMVTKKLEGNKGTKCSRYEELKGAVISVFRKICEYALAFTNFMPAKIHDFSDCVILKRFNCNLPEDQAITMVKNKILSELQLDIRRPLRKNSSSILREFTADAQTLIDEDKNESRQSFAGVASENADLKELINLMKLQLKTNAKGKDSDGSNWRKRVSCWSRGKKGHLQRVLSCLG